MVVEQSKIFFCRRFLYRLTRILSQKDTVCLETFIIPQLLIVRTIKTFGLDLRSKIVVYLTRIRISAVNKCGKQFNIALFLLLPVDSGENVFELTGEKCL